MGVGRVAAGWTAPLVKGAAAADLRRPEDPAWGQEECARAPLFCRPFPAPELSGTVTRLGLP